MDSSIVNRIKQIMAAYELKPSAFARTIGATPSTINSMLEKCTNPSFDTVMKIINAFTLIDVNWFITGKGEMYVSVNKNELAEPSVKYLKELPEVELIQKELLFKIEQIDFYKKQIDFLENKIFDLESGQKKQNGTNLT